MSVSHVNTWSSTQATALAGFTSSGTAVPGSDLELRYTYDYADRRIRRSIDDDGAARTGQESVSFAGYAGNSRTLEIARTATVSGGFAGQVIQRNFYGNGQDEILAVDRLTWSGPVTAPTSTTATYWTLGDHQDSVRDIVSGNASDRGKVVEHRQYDSFGRMVRQTTGPQVVATARAIANGPARPEGSSGGRGSRLPAGHLRRARRSRACRRSLRGCRPPGLAREVLGERSQAVAACAALRRPAAAWAVV